MSLNLRATIEGSDINGNNAEIRIYKEGFIGTAVTREGAGNMFEIIAGDSQTDSLPLVYGSRAKINFIATADYEFLDLFTANARDIYIEIELTDTGTILLKGFIEQEKYSEPLIAPPYEVTFTVYDGLGLLKDVDFLDENGDYYEGEKTPLEIAQIILSKTGLSLPLNTKVNIRPSGQSTSADALTQTVIDVVTYQGLNCYEVLEQLFQFCRIQQRGGEWYIISNDEFIGAETITCFAYTAAGAANGTKQFNTKFSNWWIEDIADLDIMPAIKQLTVKQDFGYKSNLLENPDFETLDNFGNLENWTGVNTTPQQRIYDADGNKYVYIPGNQRTVPWWDPHNIYIVSDPIAIAQATDIFNLRVDYAVMGSRSWSHVFISAYLTGDDGKFYSLVPYKKWVSLTEYEMGYAWAEDIGLFPVPMKPYFDSDATKGYLPEKISARPENEIATAFTTESIATISGIPVSGTLRVYLYAAHSSSSDVTGTCFRKLRLFLTDKDEQELPTGTELTIVNNAKNNFVPDDLEIKNGDAPAIANNETVYNAGFKLAATGELTTLWAVDGLSGLYTYAELIARLKTAEAASARQSYQADIADILPGMAQLLEDPDNSNKVFIEAGITYNFSLSKFTGRFIELKGLSLTGFTKIEKTDYTKKSSGSGSGSSTSTSGKGDVYNADERVKLIETESHTPIGQPGYLNADEFEQEIDEDTGRATIQHKKNRVYQVGHGFSQNNAIRDTATGYVKAQADTAEHANTAGIVTEVIDADNFIFQSGGFYVNPAFTRGIEYALSPDTAGLIIEMPDQTHPWTIGQVRQSLGWGTSKGLKIEIDVGDEINEFDLTGKSAYEVAVDNGFIGTETEWLASLQGADGSDGSDGTRFLSGTGAPASSLGNTLDFYLDTATGDIYKKSLTGWELKMNIQGADGQPGTDGTDGADGSRWYSATGAPSSGLGQQYDYYLDKSNGNVYVKGVSDWFYDTNIQGADGQDGTDGTDGAKWYGGGTIPDTGTGQIGDWYINYVTYDIYEKTGATTWTARGNIKGTDGQDGTDGTDGATWYTGSGAPGTGTGAVNDMYLDTSNGNVYKKTGPTSWTLQTNITGPAGADGNDATEGEDYYYVSSSFQANGTTQYIDVLEGTNNTIAARVEISIDHGFPTLKHVAGYFSATIINGNIGQQNWQALYTHANNAIQTGYIGDITPELYDNGTTVKFRIKFDGLHNTTTYHYKISVTYLHKTA